MIVDVCIIEGGGSMRVGGNWISLFLFSVLCLLILFLYHTLRGSMECSDRDTTLDFRRQHPLGRTGALVLT